MGKAWLVTLAFKTGVPPIVTFTPNEADAPDHAPYSTADELRLAMKSDKRVWCKPVDGGPGFWA